MKELQPRVSQGIATPEEKRELSRHRNDKYRNQWYGYSAPRYQRRIYKRMLERDAAVIAGFSKQDQADYKDSLNFDAYRIAKQGLYYARKFIREYDSNREPGKDSR